MPQKLSFRPLTPGCWKDLERLFGERGACGGCWCMWWKLARSEFAKRKGRKNRDAMRAIVASGEPTGLLAYAGGRAVAWCAVAPRDAYPALGRSRILAPVDERPVWSVVCFFVEREQRRRGLTVKLLRAAVAHVKKRGGRVVEGYPVDPRQPEVPAAFAWTGLASAFERAGFKEVARRSATRPIMRRLIR